MNIPRISQVIYEIETRQSYARLHHRTHESTGTPLLMIHGFGSNEKNWFNSKESVRNYFSNIIFKVKPIDAIIKSLQA